jgi:ADP-heptose:LPS heptosyltransferase
MEELLEKNLLQLAENYENNNNFKGALGIYIKMKSTKPYILNKIGMCYFNLDKYEMAIKNFEKILPLLNHPIPDLLNNIGFCYGKIKDYDSAMKYYIQSNTINPNINNYKILGDINFYIKKYDLSIKYYNKAGDSHIVLYNKCFPYLAQKQFKIGFELYEYRLFNNYCEQTKKNNRVDIPNIDYWDGKKQCNRLLVVYEQGIGDNIMFFRFVIELSIKYPNMMIDYFCKDTVRHLLNTYNNINIIDNVILALYDYKLYIMSLPKILEITNIIPNSINYIKVNKEKLEYWNQKLSTINKFKVGIVNNGLLSSFIDKNIPFEYFKKLSELNVELISLDKDNSQFEIDSDKPFEDTICILKNIDLLITVDTSIVHLAGVMNINTWLLLGYGSDWRWFNDNMSVCPWYNSVQIIRMKENKPFYNILNEVYEILSNII